MIHKIKALYDEGRGLSIRAISEELKVSRNTVRKYLRTDTVAIAVTQGERHREQCLDRHRDYIVHLLRTFPRLSSVKVARKLREKVGEVGVSARTVRRYVQRVKATVACAQPRYYEPVLDGVAGVQCQVDAGELRAVVIGGRERTVHVVVFVLSYSRLMYVGVAFEALDTSGFIRLHDEAFRYFGGVPEECVYDQTKLVVIAERFRELTVNQHFHAYATVAGFRIHACAGYDPESKGKVEAGVKYVKHDGLYGEVFTDESDLRTHVHQWLETVANARVHGTTGRVPREHFEAEERAQLRVYLAPAGLERERLQPRRVDKTGLLAWPANRYSVPMAYQRGRVGVRQERMQLHLHDLDSGECIATHALHPGKGAVVRNTDHYRDHTRQRQALEQAIAARVGAELGTALCARLQATSPRIYKDQLRAVNRLLEAAGSLDRTWLEALVGRERLTATTLKAYLDAERCAIERGRRPERDASTGPPVDLSAYAGVATERRR